MEQQAALLAYVDVFRCTAVLALICACATWLFKKPAEHVTPPPGVHQDSDQSGIVLLRGYLGGRLWTTAGQRKRCLRMIPG